MASKSKSNQPADLLPMLATLVEKPFDEEGWTYEVKWDGYRALAYLNKKAVELRSRNNKVFNEKFYPLHSALKQLGLNAILDGEIIVMNDKGISDFSDLQNWRSEADGLLVFYVFDLLWYNGKDLTQKPLLERRKILEGIIPENHEQIRLSKQFDASGKEFFEAADKMGLEGIIAKKSDSIYQPGIRTKNWLKIKTEKRQEAIIGGFTKNEGSSKKFSALLLGLYEGKNFVHIGTVGTGFTDRMQEDILKKLKPHIIKNSPFIIEPDYNKPSRFRPNPPTASVTWVKPSLVVEISYREITKDGVLRHPSLKGIREDKSVKDVHREIPADTNKIMGKETTAVKDKMIKAPGKKERASLLNPKDETQVRKINGHDLKFTNLSKIFWPDEKYTKRDLINYYYQVAPFMLPYMKDRPQTLYRHPHGITGESFYQKDVKGKAPDWIETYAYYSEADQREKEFLVCTNEASLLYIVSLGCIEMNPWSSRVQSPDNPDWCIIDLDPDKNPFDQVIQTAQVTKQILDAIDVPSYCKTSGSTGIHIYIPFGARYTYEDSKEFARKIAKLVYKELPEFTSIERATSNRKGKLYIDFLQNRPQATVSSAYSVRPKPGATVSTPLHWDEVKKGLTMKDFTIKNVPVRVRTEGDLFKPVIGKGINLQKTLKKLESVFGK